MLLFGLIVSIMLAATGWASAHQPVWLWQGLTEGKDRYWTIATLADAYCGFITFYVWVHLRERSRLTRSLWFIAIMVLGNMAMASYAFLQLSRLRSDDALSDLLRPRAWS
jgi:hypothetical protein